MATELQWSDLPDDCVQLILSHLETRDLARCSRLSKSMRKLANDDSLWVRRAFEQSPVVARRCLSVRTMPYMPHAAC